MLRKDSERSVTVPSTIGSSSVIGLSSSDGITKNSFSFALGLGDGGGGVTLLEASEVTEIQVFSLT